MTKFGERLLQAARHAGVGVSQSEIAASLGLSRQTVHHWFTKGFPTVDKIAHVARTWGVSVQWLHSGEGSMLPTTEALPADERELLRTYRTASQPARQNIMTVVRALRKSVVTIAAAIPPLMAPSHEAKAFDIALFASQSATVIHIACRWLLLRILGCQLVPA